MSQNDQVPAGTENYPVNNYIPKSNPNSRPKKFTKYAYVVKNQVVWDRMHKKYVVLEGKGQPETQPIPLLHKDNRKAYEDACDVCQDIVCARNGTIKTETAIKQGTIIFVTDGTYMADKSIQLQLNKKMRWITSIEKRARLPTQTDGEPYM